MEPFKFNIDAYYGKEIKDRVNFYRNTAFEAQGLIDRNKKQAMSILQKLKGELEEEYKYYRLSRVEKVFFLMNDLVINNYIEAIVDAYTHITKGNQYERLSSNLWDIYDYLGYLDFDQINENILYGNVYCKNTKKRFDEIGSGTNEYRLLSSLLQFYSAPTKDKAKEVAKIIRKFEVDEIRPYIYGPLLTKYL